MVKRWGAVAGTLLLLCAAPSVVMAAAGSMVTVTLGKHTATGSFGDVAKGGSDVGLSAGFRVNKWLALGADLAYLATVGEHDDQSQTVWEPTTGKYVDIVLAESWTVSELGVYGKAFIYERGHVSPYLRGGAGTYSVRWSQDVKSASAGTTVGGNEAQNKFGLSGGAGVRYRFSGGTSLGLESLVHCVFTRDVRMSMWLTGLTIGFGAAGN
jgi:opacity protein-like surface antigen